MWCTGLVAPWYAGSSWTRARTCVPCIGRQILNHCATREVTGPIFLSEKNSKYQYTEHCPLPILEEFLEEHHRVVESRLSSVSREITDSRACVREELESLYRKIVSYVLLRSGLGSPTDIKIVREATGKKYTPFPFHP